MALFYLLPFPVIWVSSQSMTLISSVYSASIEKVLLPPIPSRWLGAVIYFCYGYFQLIFNLKRDYIKNEILANTSKNKIYYLWEFFFSTDAVFIHFPKVSWSFLCTSFLKYKNVIVLATAAGCEGVFYVPNKKSVWPNNLWTPANQLSLGQLAFCIGKRIKYKKLKPNKNERLWSFFFFFQVWTDVRLSFSKFVQIL